MSLIAPEKIERWKDQMRRYQTVNIPVGDFAAVLEIIDRAADIRKIVAEQAEDEGLWFRPVYITEDDLQKALRRLHEAIEGKSQEECAIEALTK